MSSRYLFFHFEDILIKIKKEFTPTFILLLYLQGKQTKIVKNTETFATIDICKCIVCSLFKRADDIV